MARTNRGPLRLLQTADPFEAALGYVLDLDQLGAEELTVEDVLFNLND